MITSPRGSESNSEETLKPPDRAASINTTKIKAMGIGYMLTYTTPTLKYNAFITAPAKLGLVSPRAHVPGQVQRSPPQ
jgi:hypothetical protein